MKTSRRNRRFKEQKKNIMKCGAVKRPAIAGRSWQG
jgi:hypothetical protein